LRRLFQSSGLIYADEMLVQGAGMQEINKEKFARYFEKAYSMTVEEAGVQFNALFENLHLARGGTLNLAGLREQPNISFEEDRAGEQFKVAIPRPEE
jgi:hypothetical protein